MDTEIMSTQNDFLQPLLDLMNKRMDTMEAKIDANTATTDKILEQARYTNGRVTKAEKDIIRLENKGFKKLNISPNVMYLLAVGFVILLAIIASSLHIDVGGLLK